MKETYVGNGTVSLIAGGGKVYADIAARFCSSERPLSEIIASPYSPEIVHNLVSSGHLAALEFDYFIFGVEGYSRVCETQLVRKRLASYMIKSGRAQLGNKREFSMVYPEMAAQYVSNITLPDGHKTILSGSQLAGLIEQWYTQAATGGMKDEDLRYLKPQATEFRGLIGMNAHALRDWFMIRCCLNAQYEIRDMAWKMLKLCKEAAPDLFDGAGPSCEVLGYCPEGDRQNKRCAKPTKKEAKMILDAYVIQKKTEALNRLNDEMYAEYNALAEKFEALKASQESNS